MVVTHCRPLWLVLVALLSAAVCGVTSQAGAPGALYLSALGGGFAYGGYWGLMPAIASEVIARHSHADSLMLKAGQFSFGDPCRSSHTVE